jgi:hypothetical protein
VRENFDRLASQQDRRNSMPPVGSHRAQIAALRRRGINDGLVHVRVLNMQRFAGDPGVVGRGRNDAQRYAGIGIGVLLVFAG